MILTFLKMSAKRTLCYKELTAKVSVRESEGFWPDKCNE